jgi:hypothetical protein
MAVLSDASSFYCGPFVPRAVYEKYRGWNMQKVVEVYSLSLPLKSQLEEYHPMHSEGYCSGWGRRKRRCLVRNWPDSRRVSISAHTRRCKALRHLL